MNFIRNMDMDVRNVIEEEERRDSVKDEEKEFKLVGLVTEFISIEEHLWRGITIYETQPFHKVAEYLRNIDYTPDRVRSSDTLSNCTHYLLTTILPLLHNPKYHQKETIQFIENRMRAIRAEYYIQSLVDVEILEKMLRFECLASAYTGSHSGIIVVAKSLYSCYNKSPHSAKPQFLKYILLLASMTKDPNNILAGITEIQDCDFLSEYSRVCLSLKEMLFYEYFSFVRRCNYFEGCMLLPMCHKMRVKAVKVFAKSQLVFAGRELAEYLLFNKVEHLLKFLDSLGFDTALYKQHLQKEEEIKIYLKTKQSDIKITELELVMPHEIILKRAGRSEEQMILD